ncbi:pimeloyl-ACP methyl ester carboxylesterase [Bosea sp. BE271]|uniref:alpha/beta fold hydrolase n=1 Tax=Bosea TaxID=85413 RepID=UPI0028669FCC|nr:MULTISPECIES: alpha/beta hydrolase [Bosea]MDR6830740.1 pimeloyl-ACP methyl ester carboxylesterase [Bosea robiniae]MDR6895397.1 pimeloyl-ACP methyl ester carboxylesterase [Bosea sp. BE109]MDR7138793.1 pimeloyl-ACP methyl ester carboxylesterase [Bosea sp. BE168]MDR7175494.1 pimeloyl-ACP methyl ester carboxylesterase [Bosea sp. BE271]
MTQYRTLTIDGLDIFYREAGDPSRPTLLLLHGFPASSFMFRELIDRLAADFHLVAPDYPGFGYSAAPSRNGFAYSFDRLADVTAAFTEKLGLKSYWLYMQDFGGPVGFRLATRHPERIRGLIVQNANAYEEGLPDSFWAPAKALWADPSPENFQRIREAATSDDALAWNYTHGVRDAAAISPDSWILQQGLLAKPGTRDIMVDLLHDYGSNPPLYPAWQAYFRSHRPPTLIVWGQHDVIFPPVGAHPYLRDLPEAELHLLDTGHFALEEDGAVIANHIRRFASA